VIEPALTDAGNAAIIETHAMDPLRVLGAVRSLGGTLARLRVVGCEPACLGDGDTPLMALSEPVARAIEPAITLVEELVASLRAEAEACHA
jgi:hydrogenase maturation protease